MRNARACVPTPVCDEFLRATCVVVWQLLASVLQAASPLEKDPVFTILVMQWRLGRTNFLCVFLLFRSALQLRKSPDDGLR